MGIGFNNTHKTTKIIPEKVRKIMKYKIIELLLASSLLTCLTANAEGFNQGTKHNGEIMTSVAFYQMLRQTKPDQVAAHFGSPDKTQILRTATGDQEGVVWVYREAVHTDEGIKDANFIIVKGYLKYVTLSNTL